MDNQLLQTSITPAQTRSRLKLVLVFVLTILILLVIVDIFVHLFVQPIPITFQNGPIKHDYDQIQFALPRKFEESTNINHILILQFYDTVDKVIQSPFGMQLILANKNTPPLYITNSTFIYTLLDYTSTVNSTVEDLYPGRKVRIEYALETGENPKKYLRAVYIMDFN